MLLDDLMTIIAANSIATAGTDMFAGGLPEEPDEVVVLNESPGRRGNQAFSAGLPVVEYPRVQVRVRGAADEYAEGRERIESIYQLLVAKGAETASGGARYMTWDVLQPPYALGQDSNKSWKEVSAL
jgi:hypothetical protein